MAKDYQKDAQQLLDMADVNQFQRDIAGYSADALSSLSKLFITYKMENDREGYDLTLKEKISIIKDTRLSKQNYEKKTTKNIAKVIAKVQEEIKQEATPSPKSQKPRNSSLSGVSIKNSQDTPRNTGINYNTQRGQGDFFGKTSAFRFIKQMSDNMQSDSSNDNQMGFDFGDKVKKTGKPSTKSNTVGKLSITHLEPKALKQIKDILMLPEKIAKQSGGSDKPKRTVRRATKFEKDNQALRARDADIRARHVEVISEKIKATIRLTKLKSKIDSDKSEEKFKQKLEELREKYKHITDKLSLSNDFQVNREKLKQSGKAHSDETRLKLKKMSYEHSRDIAKDKLDAQVEKSKLARSQQLHRDFHSIHPALGMLYGLSQNKKEQSQNNGNSGGFGISDILGGVAGGAGAMGIKGAFQKFASNGLKMGGSRIPIVGGLITAYYESLDEGVAKGLTAGAGVTAGGAIGATIGTALLPGIGTAIGAVIGSWLGGQGARELFDNFKRDGIGSSGLMSQSSSSLMQGMPLNGSVVKIPKSSDGKVSSMQSNSQTSTGNAEKDFLNFISKGEAEDYNTLYGGGKADLTNMTLAEVAELQKNSKNFANNGASRGVGKYQFTMKPFEEEVAKSGLDPKTTKFTPEIQDKLIMQRLKRMRGYDDFMSGKISKVEFGNKIAEELASLPVLSDFAGKSRGQSRYAGDGLNKSLTDADSFENAIDKLGQSRTNLAINKAPSKSQSLMDTTNKVQDKSMADKSKPISVVNVGGSSGGSSNVVNNTYVNPPNMDATIRLAQNNLSYPARIV